jgi:hypothetical protein
MVSVSLNVEPGKKNISWEMRYFSPTMSERSWVTPSFPGFLPLYQEYFCVGVSVKVPNSLILQGNAHRWGKNALILAEKYQREKPLEMRIIREEVKRATPSRTRSVPDSLNARIRNER